jgi:hypothetical protein
MMRTMKSLAVIAALSLAFQPCLACARGHEGPEVRTAEGCHGSSGQVRAVCHEIGNAAVVVVPATQGVAIHPPAPPPLWDVLWAHALDQATFPASAPSDGPPLWLRHGSLLV